MQTRNIHQLPTEQISAHDGIGLIDFVRVYGGEMAPLPNDSALNFVDFARLPPGTSVGFHEHEDSSEVYLILSGNGLYRYNAESWRVSPGDVLVNHRGWHSLTNDTSEPLEIFVIESAAGEGS